MYKKLFPSHRENVWKTSMHCGTSMAFKPKWWPYSGHGRVTASNTAAPFLDPDLRFDDIIRRILYQPVSAPYPLSHLYLSLIQIHIWCQQSNMYEAEPNDDKEEYFLFSPDKSAPKMTKSQHLMWDHLQWFVETLTTLIYAPLFFRENYTELL